VGDIESIMYQSNHHLNIPKNIGFDKTPVKSSEFKNANFTKKDPSSTNPSTNFNLQSDTITTSELAESKNFDSLKDELNKTYFNNDISDQGLITQRENDHLSDDEPSNFAIQAHAASKGQEYMNFEE
jgi:hypothetical protein